MKYKNSEDFLKKVELKNPHEKEFHQAAREVVESLWPFLEKNKHYLDSAILDRIVEPERVLMFRVPWVDDKGKTQVNKG